MKRILLLLFLSLAIGIAPALSPWPTPWAAGHAQAVGGAPGQEAERYTCPMHPHYVSDDQGTCPICGMDLVPMDGTPEAGGGGAGSVGPAVTVAPHTIQTVGVRVAEVERADFGGRVEAFAQIVANERARSSVSTRVPGWVEVLHVQAVGDEVALGELLFELYSPDLIAAQLDYFSARASNARRAETALRRLESLGMGPVAIARMRERSEPLRTVPFFATRDGVVSELPVSQGDYVPVGADILSLQDYSTVWVIAEVPQSDLVHLAENQRAHVTLARDGAAVSGEIDYVYPTFDTRTRTGRVRVIVLNPRGALRPGAFANVMFEGDIERRLAVPSEAVLYDGTGSRVVMALEGGRFEPRAIETGLSAGGFTEVLSGLAEGETVVASGQFLIDSESRLRESFSRMQGADGPLSGLELSDAELSMIDHVVDAALYAHEALRDGYPMQTSFFQPAIEAAEAIQARYPGQLADVMGRSAAALEDLSAARAPSDMRDALAAVVDALRPWLMSRPVRYQQLGVELYEADGRSWLEVGTGGLFNPFGEGEPQRVPWPDATASAEPDQAMDEDAMRQGAGHANH